MPRPTGKTNFLGRLKAYELYAAGMRKAEIAREVNVTRGAVSEWCRKDRWDERLAGGDKRAADAVDFVRGNEVAATIARLRSKLMQRVNELELLCGPGAQPHVRLKAIEQWIKLATSDKLLAESTKAIPTAAPLTLEDDLDGVRVGGHSSDHQGDPADAGVGSGPSRSPVAEPSPGPQDEPSASAPAIHASPDGGRHASIGSAGRSSPQDPGNWNPR